MSTPRTVTVTEFVSKALAELKAAAENVDTNPLTKQASIMGHQAQARVYAELALALATLDEMPPPKGIFVPADWVGKKVIVQLDVPQWAPKSELATAGGPPKIEDMGLMFPEVHGLLVADLPEGLVLNTKGMPFGYAIMKGKVHAVLLDKGLDGPGGLIT